MLVKADIIFVINLTVCQKVGMCKVHCYVFSHMSTIFRPFHEVYNEIDRSVVTWCDAQCTLINKVMINI